MPLQPEPELPGAAPVFPPAVRERVPVQERQPPGRLASRQRPVQAERVPAERARAPEPWALPPGAARAPVRRPGGAEPAGALLLPEEAPAAVAAQQAAARQAE